VRAMLSGASNSLVVVLMPFCRGNKRPNWAFSQGVCENFHKLGARAIP
jgi:hypothetical protein